MQQYAVYILFYWNITLHHQEYIQL